MRTPSRLTLAGLAALTFALSACTSTGATTTGLGNVGSPATPTTTGQTTTPIATATVTGTTKANGGGGGTSGGGGGGGGGSGTSSPKINSFVMVQKPSCPVIASSDSPFSAPGTPIELKFKVSGTGVTGAALSIDDPTYFDKNHSGGYQDYGTSGDVTINFECDITQQPNTTHTYTLDTIGGGATAAKTLTVTVPTSP